MSHLLCLSLLAWAAAAAADQPIAYSHKTHLRLGLKCAECHTMPGKGEAAGFPPESRCMACHIAVKKDSPEIRKLAAYAAEGKPVPWVRVYRLPEFVWFSHKRHVVDAKAGCEVCHGRVQDRDVVVKEHPIDMKWCVDCHEQRGASTECDLCHNP